MSETWLPVVGYEGFYEVSDHGRVRSVDRTITRKDGHVASYKGRLLKLHADEYGYFEAVLCRNCKGKTVGVHILMCAAFHGPKPEWAHGVRHLNGINVDNRPENLRWGTHKENMQDIISHGRNYWINQTHCKYGHEFTPENTRRERNGRKRACRQCSRYRVARRRATNRKAA